MDTETPPEHAGAGNDSAQPAPAPPVPQPPSLSGWRAFLRGLRPRFLGTTPLDLRITILAFPIWAGFLIALTLGSGVRMAGWDRLLLAGGFLVATFLGFLYGRTWALVLALIPMALFLLIALWGFFVGSVSLLSFWGPAMALTAAGVFVFLRRRKLFTNRPSPLFGAALPADSKLRWWKTLGLGLLLFVLDGLFIGSPLVGMLLCLALAVACFVSVARADVREVAPYLRRGVFYLALAIYIPVFVLKVDVDVAEERAQTIIEAAGKFKAQTGAYPEALEDLVPTYLSRVPSCCTRLTQADFKYAQFPDSRHRLWWSRNPPFIRSFYTFETGQWGYP